MGRYMNYLLLCPRTNTADVCVKYYTVCYDGKKQLEDPECIAAIRDVFKYCEQVPGCAPACNPPLSTIP
jgi:hypothetical protein